MTRKPSHRLTTTLSVAAVVCSSAAHAAPPPPNVILVMSDDQGYGELSCHGNPVLQTPQLDRLHSQSIRLANFHVAPMCTPTRGQLLTGCDALRNGAMNVSSGRTMLRLSFPTMADIFADSGYRTAMFGKWHLGDDYPYRPQDRGFNESVWFPSSHINSVPDYWDNDYFDDVYRHNGKPQNYEGYCTDVFFRLAMDWMDQCISEGQPFFTYLPLNAAHWPHFVPDEFRGPVAEALDRAAPDLPPLTPQQREDLISYLAMIANIDLNMGRLEQFIEDRGIRDNTILIFLSDNGTTMGPLYFNAGMRGKKATLWEGGHRVPCFIRWPAGHLRPPSDIAGLTQVQDLLPTLVELCNLKQPDSAHFDGISLAPVLRDAGTEPPDRMLVVHFSRMPRDTHPQPDSAAIPVRAGAAVMWGRWRLLEEKQLYDLSTDPAQQTNVIDQHPAVASAMQDYLAQWWDGLKNNVATPSPVVIGDPHSNPTMLTACDWLDVFLDQQRQVRRGDRKNSYWCLEVAQAGEYEFELRRWPREADLALDAPITETKVTDGTYVSGPAWPVAQARMSIAGHDEKQPVASGSRAATFRAHLEAGPTELHTSFDDAEGNEICGAYYVYVKRLD